MSKVLFLGVPSHGHTNPTLGLVNELVKQGEEVVYFSSELFKEKIEGAGATFKAYCEDLDIFKAEVEGEPDPLQHVIASADKIIEDILQQTKGITFDYMIHSIAFPFTGVIKQLLNIPTVSSLAIFAGLADFFKEDESGEQPVFPGMLALLETYKATSQRVREKFGVTLPENMMHLLMNKGDLNFVYTSTYFIAPKDLAFFDGSYRLVGPPIYARNETTDFPFAKLKDKKVIYISLGTVFGNFNASLYPVFFESFGNTDAVVVMAAYGVDLSHYTIPANFIVRNYVPQSELLKHTTVAITHGGMNSMSDLIYNNVPFVCLPLGADQPELAARARELGATISLNAEGLTAAELKSTVDTVVTDPAYLENIKKINASFREAGGYKKAVEEIFKLKKEKGI